MNYRELGKTGIKVSEIGFGAWGIGGPSRNAPGYGEVDDKESIKALKYAYDNRINFLIQQIFMVMDIAKG